MQGLQLSPTAISTFFSFFSFSPPIFFYYFVCRNYALSFSAHTIAIAAIFILLYSKYSNEYKKE
jgi:hypothetical protein